MSTPAGAWARLLVIEHSADTGLGRLAAGLGPVDVCRPYLGFRVPERADGYRGLVVLGGDMAAWDDDVAEWLPATRDLLADAVRQRLPTLGVCLGAQLLAVATGGTVETGAAGVEIGMVDVRALDDAAEDVMFGRVLGRLGLDAGQHFRVPQYHHDAIVDLPPDAELLVEGETYAVQAFRVGDAAWGLQYHPEVSPSGFASWVADARRELAAAGLDPEKLTASVAESAGGLAWLAAAHATAFTESARRRGGG